MNGWQVCASAESQCAPGKVSHEVAVMAGFFAGVDPPDVGVTAYSVLSHRAQGQDSIHHWWTQYRPGNASFCGCVMPSSVFMWLKKKSVTFSQGPQQLLAEMNATFATYLTDVSKQRYRI